MITKDDLKGEFNISLDTVRRTLEACGLDPNKEEFSEEDITTFFRPARRMVAEKKTLKEVRAWAESLRRNGAKTGGAPRDNIRTLLDAEMYAVTDRMVADSVEKHIDEIPEMYARHLWRHLEDKSVQGAFLRWEERVLEEMERAPLQERANDFYSLPGDTIDVDGQNVDDDAEAP